MGEMRGENVEEGERGEGREEDRGRGRDGKREDREGGEGERRGEDREEGERGDGRGGGGDRGGCVGQRRGEGEKKTRSGNRGKPLIPAEISAVDQKSKGTTVEFEARPDCLWAILQNQPLQLQVYTSLH